MNDARQVKEVAGLVGESFHLFKDHVVNNAVCLGWQPSVAVHSQTRAYLKRPEAAIKALLIRYIGSLGVPCSMSCIAFVVLRKRRYQV